MLLNTATKAAVGAGGEAFDINPVSSKQIG